VINPTVMLFYFPPPPPTRSVMKEDIVAILHLWWFHTRRTFQYHTTVPSTQVPWALIQRQEQESEKVRR